MKDFLVIPPRPGMNTSDPSHINSHIRGGGHTDIHTDSTDVHTDRHTGSSGSINSGDSGGGGSSGDATVEEYQRRRDVFAGDKRYGMDRKPQVCVCEFVCVCMCIYACMYVWGIYM